MSKFKDGTFLAGFISALLAVAQMFLQLFNVRFDTGEAAKVANAILVVFALAGIITASTDPVVGRFNKLFKRGNRQLYKH